MRWLCHLVPYNVFVGRRFYRRKHEYFGPVGGPKALIVLDLGAVQILNKVKFNLVTSLSMLKFCDSIA